MTVTSDDAALQLLLFVDDRPNALELSNELSNFLVKEQAKVAAELQIINVSEYPDLVEHFKVVMTPALIKTNPLPRQTITGKNIMAELQNYWDSWRHQVSSAAHSQVSSLNPDLSFSSQLLRLSDQIFQLNQAKQELEEQLRFKDRIISMLAHDLRNPLTAVSLALETVEISGDRLSAAKRQELFQHARRQVKISDSMIADILEASHHASLELRLQRTNLAQIWQNLISDFSLNHQLEAKQLSLEVNIPPDLPFIFADEERIRQVVINILENAIKYTPAGGKISVSALHRTAQKLEVMISDTGVGIPAEMKEKIFEHRYRIQANNHAAGYGIGLDTCQQIIRAHYGQIWVDASGKQGSCFHFTLPVY
ncbi:MAG: histidine kinase [Pseudanabaenaceae cyanobacterium bins.68]|nr:histidine kinase [Pseudanabaenaceae cyanobacterium bins.68]